MSYAWKSESLFSLQADCFDIIECGLDSGDLNFLINIMLQALMPKFKASQYLNHLKVEQKTSARFTLLTDQFQIVVNWPTGTCVNIHSADTDDIICCEYISIPYLQTIA